jgi:hypothetical protein
MCLNAETVEALHAVTSELKACNDQRDAWMDDFDRELPESSTGLETEHLAVTRAEAEMIFTARRTAIEAKLKDLGWSKTTRVESTTGDTK